MYSSETRDGAEDMGDSDPSKGSGDSDGAALLVILMTDKGTLRRETITWCLAASRATSGVKHPLPETRLARRRWPEEHAEPEVR
jgi:hypothetical protein